MCTPDDEGAGVLGGALDAAVLPLELLGEVVGELDGDAGALLVGDCAVAPDVACLVPPHAVSVSAHATTTSATLRVEAQPMRGMPRFCSTLTTVQTSG